METKIEDIEPKDRELFDNMMGLAREYLDKVVDEMCKERIDISPRILTASLMGGPTFVVCRLINLISRTCNIPEQTLIDMFNNKLKLTLDFMAEASKELE